MTLGFLSCSYLSFCDDRRSRCAFVGRHVAGRAQQHELLWYVPSDTDYLLYFALPAVWCMFVCALFVS